MSPDELKEIIDAGHDLAALKYYKLACIVILFYDYLLILDDEVKFVWRGRRSWVSVLFIANRYLPMGYEFLSLMVSYRPTFSQRICNKTVFLSLLTYTAVTIFAQVILTLRIYAITLKNRIITACCCVIAVAQFAFGVYITTALATVGGAQQMPPIPLDAYQVCAVAADESAPMLMAVGFASLSLAYDVLIFSTIVYTAWRSNLYQFRIPSLLRTILRDATHYFLVIFTSQLLLVFITILGRPSIRFIPAHGNYVYLPVMIGRLMLSLRKAASSQGDAWSFGEPTTNIGMRFAERRGPVTTGDGVHLDTFSGEREGAQSRA